MLRSAVPSITKLTTSVLDINLACDARGVAFGGVECKAYYGYCGRQG